MTTMSPSSSLIIYTDGSLTPDGAGAGVVVLDHIGRLIHIENQTLAITTNNEAEYAALALGLKIAVRLRAEVVEIRADSEVMVNQMLGHFAVKSHRLKQFHWQVCELARKFPRVRYTHIPREQNALADTLAAEASAGRIWALEAR